MVKGVVNSCKGVKIQENNDDRKLVADGHLTSGVEKIIECLAVGKASEWIGNGLFFSLLLRINITYDDDFISLDILIYG